MKDRVIEILGSRWTIKFGDESQYEFLKESDGHTDTSTRTIVIDNMESVKDEPNCKGNIQMYQKQVIRREIIHAFLAESGLDGEGTSPTHWELNEEMADWFAIQSPKIFNVYCKLGLF